MLFFSIFFLHRVRLCFFKRIAFSGVSVNGESKNTIDLIINIFSKNLINLKELHVPTPLPFFFLSPLETNKTN
jgi:hypothetical protein